MVIRFDAAEFDFKKSSRAKKMMAQAEKIGGKVIALNRRTLANLAKTLSDAAKKRRCTLSDAKARYLVETAGDALSTLRNEIELDVLFTYGTYDNTLYCSFNLC